MDREVVWTRRAQKDLADIITYWSEKNGNNSYSKKLYEDFMSIDSLINAYPFIGKESNYCSSRVYIKKNYSIFYTIDKNKIYIIHVWDNRRNPEDLKL